MEKRDVIAALCALAQDTRLDVFRLLIERGPKGLSAGAVAAALGLPAATLSFHLKELRQAGLVRRARNGRTLVYAADYSRMEELLRFLTENCCRDSASLTLTHDGEHPCVYNSP